MTRCSDKDRHTPTRSDDTFRIVLPDPAQDTPHHSRAPGPDARCKGGGVTAEPSGATDNTINHAAQIR
jgi:hypothetical protein